MDVPNFNSLSYQAGSRHVNQWVSLSSLDHGRFMDADGGLQVQAGSWNSGMQNSNSSTGSNVSFVGMGYGNGLQMPKEEVSSWEDASPFASPESMSVPMPVPRSPLGVVKTQPVSRAGGDAQGHIMAERRRREKLSQRFIALSAIVPGLKKTDKASVLGDTIKYLRQMEERVKSLEEEAKQKTVHSMVLQVKKPQLLPSRDEAPSSEPETDSFHTSFNDALPEIEARICDKSVLIRIVCEKRQGGVVEQVLAEVEKLHLTIINSSVLSFGASSLNIIIVAQVIGGSLEREYVKSCDLVIIHGV
uniref:BHLH domain-containing protein n=1 Tax=Kalanchoe fedtschenkoi TaxID=63787 RepID=A0A7N0T0E1_KALFE